jgi:DNA topoisomerase IB
MGVAASTDRLVYVSGGELGLQRVRRDGAFVILDEHGERVTDDETLERVRALRIPPAWTDVWIAGQSNAHLQATGHDSKGRRQYLYHPLWRHRRDEEKFDDMLDFARRLPEIRARARRYLSSEIADRERTLALAIRLLDVGLFRVGWDRYARDNGHVGLTTLRRENVTLSGVEVRFDFVAKSGKRRRMTVRDPQSVRALGQLRRRRGSPPELLVYPSPHGWRRIHAPDVNNTLRCWGEGPYSAKEFRTWAATVLAAVALAHEHEVGNRGPRAVSRAVREVSTALGNTPTVARSSYIDPRVIAAFEDDVVVDIPDVPSAAAVEMRVEASGDEVVLELPTDVDENAVRVDIERRVCELLVRP